MSAKHWWKMPTGLGPGAISTGSPRSISASKRARSSSVVNDSSSIQSISLTDPDYLGSVERRLSTCIRIILGPFEGDPLIVSFDDNSLVLPHHDPFGIEALGLDEKDDTPPPHDEGGPERPERQSCAVQLEPLRADDAPQDAEAKQHGQDEHEKEDVLAHRGAPPVRPEEQHQECNVGKERAEVKEDGRGFHDAVQRALLRIASRTNSVKWLFCWALCSSSVSQSM